MVDYEKSPEYSPQTTTQCFTLEVSLGVHTQYYCTVRCIKKYSTRKRWLMRTSTVEHAGPPDTAAVQNGPPPKDLS